jgi:hypothetical protein
MSGKSSYYIVMKDSLLTGDVFRVSLEGRNSFIFLV